MARNTANVDSLRDISVHVATKSPRRCCAGHFGDSACPLMFQVHSLNIAKVCDTLSHVHLRVTSMIQLLSRSSFWRQRWSIDFSDAWLPHCHRFGKKGRTVDSSVCPWCVSRQWTGRCAGVPSTNSCFVSRHTRIED